MKPVQAFEKKAGHRIDERSFPQGVGMRGFVLAAGFGTRLKPLTDHIPKALVPICGVPLLERIIHRLEVSGITDVAVNVHYLPESIERFRSRSARNFEVFHEKDRIRGTGGALDVARGFLGGDEAFIVWNVDIISNVNIQEAARHFLQSGAICGLLAVPGGMRKTVLYYPHSMRYVGTPRDTEDASRCAGADYIGIALYRREFLEFVRPDDFSIVSVWKRAAETGADIRVFEVGSTYWRDAGTPAALAAVHFDVCMGQLTLSTPEWMVVDTVRGLACHKGLSSRIGNFVAPCWVEPVEVPQDCRIGNSVVLSGATVPSDRNQIQDLLITSWGEFPL